MECWSAEQKCLQHSLHKGAEISRRKTTENTLQLELKFDFGVHLETEIEEKKLPYIHGFHFNFPDPQNYFGISGVYPLDSPFKKKLFSDQQALFNDELPLIKMTVSDFILAHKCPKIFNGYWLEKSPPRPPHHPVFDVGTKVDMLAKAYLCLPVEARQTNRQLLRDTLQHEIEKLKHWHDSPKTQVYLEAFDDFCEYFKNAQLSTKIAPDEWLKFKFENFRLGGRIDILLQDWLEHKNLLLDLKLEKFGTGLRELQFSEIVQVMLYANELCRRDVAIQEVGYYYFKERTLLVQAVTSTDLQQFARILRKLATTLEATVEFIPRQCELCLICPLRYDCDVGRELTKQDFINPLK